MIKRFQNGTSACPLPGGGFTLVNPDLRPKQVTSRSSKKKPADASLPSVANKRNRPLRVMKFGGTSLADAHCIQKASTIVREAASQADVTVVVSAMAGVTDALLDVVAAAEAGHRYRVALLLNRLRTKHINAATALIGSLENWRLVMRRMYELFAGCDRICEEVIAQRQATPAQQDAICGLGERISAPLVSAALLERGVPSAAIEATELIVTDENHGAAEPVMSRTREQCLSRLKPLLDRAIVPVVTGFIGATREGRLTTLGRGGSDYSATIIAAALHAAETIIWTDVDGLMTADPRSVPGAQVISEISYREAAELASFGAKVLHHKTLDAITESGIPLWIRNTLAPHLPGTKITPQVSQPAPGVRSLTSTTKVAAMIMSGTAGRLDRSVETRAIRVATRASRRLLMVGSSRDQLGFVVDSDSAQAAVQQLEREFEAEISSGELENIRLETRIGLVTAVGSKLSDIAGSTQEAIEDAGVAIVLSSREASGSSLCFAVDANDVTRAVTALHRVFVLNKVSTAQPDKRLDFPGWEAYSAD